jgi:hypothetical protein
MQIALRPQIQCGCVVLVVLCHSVVCVLLQCTALCRSLVCVLLQCVLLQCTCSHMLMAAAVDKLPLNSKL